MRIHRGVDSLRSMLSSLSELREKRCSCDHRIVCEGDSVDEEVSNQIHLHSLILRSCSSTVWQESSPSVTRVCAPPSIVERLVRFLYGEIVDLEEGEEETFWKAALELGLQHLVVASDRSDGDDDANRVAPETLNPEDGASQPSTRQTELHLPASTKTAQSTDEFIKTEAESDPPLDSETTAAERGFAVKLEEDEEEEVEVTYGDVLGLEDFASRSGRESDWDEGLDILGIKLPSELVLRSLVEFKKEVRRNCEGKTEAETADAYYRMASRPFPRTLNQLMYQTSLTSSNSPRDAFVKNGDNGNAEAKDTSATTVRLAAADKSAADDGYLAADSLKAADSLTAADSGIPPTDELGDVDKPHLFDDFLAANVKTEPSEIEGEPTSVTSLNPPLPLPPPPPPPDAMFSCYICGFRSKKKPVVVAHVRSLHKDELSTAGGKVNEFFGIGVESTNRCSISAANDTQYNSFPPPPPHLGPKTSIKRNASALPLQVFTPPPPKYIRSGIRYNKTFHSRPGAVSSAAASFAFSAAATAASTATTAASRGKRKPNYHVRMNWAFPKGPRYKNDKVDKVDKDDDGDPDWTPPGEPKRPAARPSAMVSVNPALANFAIVAPNADVAREQGMTIRNHLLGMDTLPVPTPDNVMRKLTCQICRFTTSDAKAFALHRHDSFDIPCLPQSRPLQSSHPPPPPPPPPLPLSTSNSTFECPFVGCSYSTHKDSYLDKHLWFRHHKIARNGQCSAEEGDIFSPAKTSSSGDAKNPADESRSSEIETRPTSSLLSDSKRNDLGSGRIKSPADFIRSLNSLVCGPTDSAATAVFNARRSSLESTLSFMKTVPSFTSTAPSISSTAPCSASTTSSFSSTTPSFRSSTASPVLAGRSVSASTVSAASHSRASVFRSCILRPSASFRNEAATTNLSRNNATNSNEDAATATDSDLKETAAISAAELMTGNELRSGPFIESLETAAISVAEVMTGNELPSGPFVESPETATISAPELVTGNESPSGPFVESPETDVKAEATEEFAGNDFGIVKKSLVDACFD